MPKEESKKSEIKTLPKETRLLTCKLNTDELLRAGQDLARINQDIEREEKDQTDAKQQMKAHMTELEARRIGISLKISRQAEERSVEVEPIYDYTAGKYIETRLDTGEVIINRPLFDSERQETLV